LAVLGFEFRTSFFFSLATEPEDPADTIKTDARGPSALLEPRPILEEHICRGH
jgi:hypothetical protein